MTIYSEAYIKDLLNKVTKDEISFSKYVEELNQTAYQSFIKKDSPTSLMDIVKVCESFLAQPEQGVPKIRPKILEFKDFLMSDILGYCRSVLDENKEYLRCKTWCKDCKAFDWSSCKEKYL